MLYCPDRFPIATAASLFHNPDQRQRFIERLRHGQACPYETLRLVWRK